VVRRGGADALIHRTAVFRKRTWALSVSKLEAQVR
jgi:hypothetical protein